MGMKYLLSALVLTTLTTVGFCAELEEQTPNPGALQVVPVEPSKFPDHVETYVIYPKDKELRKSSPIKGQIRVESYALGVDTEQPRSREIWNDSEGQSLHIFIDDQPYFAVNEALIDALDDIEDYYDQTADFEIPFKLQPGMHVIRTFPVTSYNESVKSNKAFAASTFYYQERKSNPAIDLSKPYLTYNEPQGEYNFKQNQPILLDFYLTNCDLSKDGYKVRLTIDNADVRNLTSWQPYYIYGLTKGRHRIRLVLLDPQNKPAPGLFNDVTRTIYLR